jgi:putative cardiolipin synthase
MTGSGRSLPRSSSYEKGAFLAHYGPSGAADARRIARTLAGRATALVLGLAGALLAGCGTLPTNVGKTDSSALPLDPASPLVRIAVSSIPAPEQTGVRLLPLGAYSLDTRIQLAQRATSSLDVQYYVLENDPTGRLLMTALRDASARGVRVRLLIDDLYTSHSDPLLRGLASFPNFEVRLFNPFCCNRSGGVGGRYTASIFDFGRLNHRMHNKLFIADGVMAVAGGRNIADEYFLRAMDANFVDMDAFVMGAVVRSMSTIFDRYWNSEVVFPIEAVGEPLGDKSAHAKAFDVLIASLPPSPPVDPPATDLLGLARSSKSSMPARSAWVGASPAPSPTLRKLLAMSPNRVRDERHQRRDDAGLAGQRATWC